MSKRSIAVIIYSALLALGFFLIVQDVYSNRNHCPAPTDLESMEVYQYLSQAVAEEMTTAELAQVFSQMCAMPVECLDDTILRESLYDEQSGCYNIHIARQFQFSDSTEFVQLHLVVTYAAESADGLPETSAWCDNGSADIREILDQWQAFEAVKSQTLKEVRVFIDWTW